MPLGVLEPKKIAHRCHQGDEVDHLCIPLAQNCTFGRTELPHFSFCWVGYLDIEALEQFVERLLAHAVEHREFLVKGVLGDEIESAAILENQLQKIERVFECDAVDSSRSKDGLDRGNGAEIKLI